MIEIGGEEEDVIQIASDSEEQPSSKGGGQTGDALIISCQVRPWPNLTSEPEGIERKFRERMQSQRAGSYPLTRCHVCDLRQGVLLGKGKVPGDLSLLDAHLVFSPKSKEQAESSLRIENASIISMQETINPH